MHSNLSRINHISPQNRPQSITIARCECKSHSVTRLGLASLMLATALALSACATGNDSFIPSPAPKNSNNGLGTITPRYPAPRNVANPGLTPHVAATLSLSQAISLSIEHNPKLQSFAWDAQGALARIRQARIWPNPELEYEMENFGGTGKFSGSAYAETTVSLAQNLPIGGDIKHRRVLAELESQLADWDYHAARLDVIVDVTQRFVVALAADRKLELAKQELNLAKATEMLTQNRVDTGDASPVELTRVVVPVVTAELGLARAERTRDAAYRRLSLSWGDREVLFIEVAGDLDSVSPPPSPESLIQHVSDNPDVARWAVEISTRITEQRLAKAQAIPNLTGRIGLKRDRESGDEALVVGLSLPLPLFDRGQEQIKSARSGEASARSRQRAAELRVEGLLSEAYASLANAYDETIAIRDRALPAADRAYRGTQLAFKEGKLPFLDVLDAQRTLFELQERYVQALEDYHLGVAFIESIIGRSIADLQK